MSGMPNKADQMQDNSADGIFSKGSHNIRFIWFHKPVRGTWEILSRKSKLGEGSRRSTRATVAIGRSRRRARGEDAPVRARVSGVGLVAAAGFAHVLEKPLAQRCGGGGVVQGPEVRLRVVARPEKL